MRGKIGLQCVAAALLASAAAWCAGAPPLEEEAVNPSEVVFDNGKPYMSVNGEMLALQTRQQGGQTVYYRMVRYDPQEGYVTGDGSSVARLYQAPAAQQQQETPLRYYGAGLYGPDFQHSPYNRDARQRYWGPGYFGSCSIYDGCKEVQFLPAVPYRFGY